MNNFAVISPFTILFTHLDNPLVLNIYWKFPDCFFQFKIELYKGTLYILYIIV